MIKVLEVATASIVEIPIAPTPLRYWLRLVSSDPTPRPVHADAWDTKLPLLSTFPTTSFDGAGEMPDLSEQGRGRVDPIEAKTP